MANPYFKNGALNREGRKKPHVKNLEKAPKKGMKMPFKDGKKGKK